MSFNTCIITSALPPNIKGVQILVDNFIEIMEPISDTIYLIAGNYHDDISEHKFNLINLKMDDKKQTIIFRIPKFIFIQLKMGYMLLKIRKKIDFTVFFISTPFIIPLLTSKLLNKRIIMIATGSSSKGARQHYKSSILGMGLIIPEILKLLERINYYFSDRIVVLSKGLMHDLDLTKYQDKIDYACATFVDTNHFCVKTDLQNRDIIIGFIGRLTETKGIMQFVQSIKLLSKNGDLSFFIGGDGHLRDKIMKELLKDDLKHSVTFKGWISHDDLPEYLNLLKLIVVPSYTEAFPAIGLEAMACGTPVLINSVGGVPDIIKDGENGFIMENNSPESIAANVQRILNRTDLENIAKNARKSLENDFSYENIIEKYEKVVKNCY
ncbi:MULTISPECIES: glycosyltransferase family 4 protein [Methanobacterium]|uniref:Glycosyl transferase family 1 domain-containing protein n=1 Tax=Methanobacterium bryantii TaxID=2161 RepID=A0A2A2H391_METBR|nr:MULTISPECIES: glycosyltransferase family 4 protein [Methanobacterium]OEC86111.1 hypothetical protein A9507_11715 [Methanobacterium sp. A39]PAV03901.1 hypothetical protein ASJ80_02455 [Methanobacterium bryantii]